MQTLKMSANVYPSHRAKLELLNSFLLVYHCSLILAGKREANSGNSKKPRADLFISVGSDRMWQQWDNSCGFETHVYIAGTVKGQGRSLRNEEW